MDFTEMKDRISHIIRAKNLTAAEFALRLGIQPSNVSHLISGRNNPSLDFVKKLKETFPEYSLDWLVFGRGPMTLSEPYADSGLYQIPSGTVGMEDSRVQFKEDTFSNKSDDVDTPKVLSSSLSGLSVKEMIIVYSDNTFERLKPR